MAQYMLHVNLVQGQEVAGFVLNEYCAHSYI